MTPAVSTRLDQQPTFRKPAEFDRRETEIFSQRSDLRCRSVVVNRNAWTLSDSSGKPHEFPIDPIVVANDPTALRAALLAGIGIMLTTDVWVRAYVEQGQVQRVLTGWRGVDVDLSALFPHGQVQSPKVRAFVDFLAQRLNIEQNYARVSSDPADSKR